MGRLIALVLATLGLILSGGYAQAVSVVSEPVAAGYWYDSPHYDSMISATATERGPPEPGTRYTTYDAVELSSSGAPVRPNSPTPAFPYDYDRPARFEQVAGVASTSEEGARVAEVRSAVVGRDGVAAKAGPKALTASTRVAPWAGSSLSRLSREGEVMYRVYGGGAGKAGSWLTPINPVSSAAARQGLALPAENAALYVSKVTLPGGVRMQVGTAGSAFGQPGGWAQAQLLERIPLSSFGKGVPLQ